MLICQGRIVRANVLDPQGQNPKVRSLVIVTATSKIAAADSVAGVAITGSFSDPLADDEVLLPWRKDRHPKTGLHKPCVAKCSWVCAIKPTDILERAGIVPPAVLDQIIAKVTPLVD